VQSDACSVMVVWWKERPHTGLCTNEEPLRVLRRLVPPSSVALRCSSGLLQAGCRSGPAAAADRYPLGPRGQGAGTSPRPHILAPGPGAGGGNRPPRRQADPGAPSLPRGAPKGRHNCHFQPAAGESDFVSGSSRYCSNFFKKGRGVRAHVAAMHSHAQQQTARQQTRLYEPGPPPRPANGLPSPL
jgi:hypothetical protein